MKKIVSIVLGITLVFGSFGLAFGETPTDVAGTEYAEAVAAMSDLGIIDGYPDGTFRPD